MKYLSVLNLYYNKYIYRINPVNTRCVTSAVIRYTDILVGGGGKRIKSDPCTPLETRAHRYNI